MIYKSGWGTETEFFPTFKMLPVTQDCPFNEVLFDPKSKILAIVGKEKKQAYRMLPKLNDKGKQVVAMERGVPVEVQERKLMENFYEYYLEEIEDIEYFINKFAINSKDFNWMSFINSEKES
jgi:hypothetical protein